MLEVVGKLSRFACGSVALMALTTGANAQSSGDTKIVPGLIDAELQTSVDFRDLVFQSCYERSSCEVGNFSISATRLDAQSGEWIPAKIYWDPIDGFGVLEGGQDDEIDIDERLTVNFAKAKVVRAIWYSDLFAKEHVRYQKLARSRSVEGTASAKVSRNYETAFATFSKVVGQEETFLTTGVVDLPDREFNEIVDASIFDTGGDLRKRLLLEAEEPKILAGTQEAVGQSNDRAVLTLAVDPSANKAKNVQLDNEPYALAFSARSPLPWTSGQTSNSKKFDKHIGDHSKLQELFSYSGALRLAGDVSNGEISQTVSPGIWTKQIVFSAASATSNDYSIAGLVFQSEE